MPSASELRPFYFIVVVWGKLYVEYLVNYCIASLLSPNNIPAMQNKGNKFLIATTIDDWESMQELPLFKKLQEYMDVVFLRIPPCPIDLTKCSHMGMGHKFGTEMAMRDRAYGAILTPDMVVSDGTVRCMVRHACMGRHVVLTAALRMGTEPLSENLYIGPTGQAPLMFTPRQLVAAALHSMHSETLAYEWAAPYKADFDVALWWKVPHEQGIILHSMSWMPILIDYAAVPEHDTTAMDKWSIDGNYIYHNFRDYSKIHVVTDSDEMIMISWGSLHERPVSLMPKAKFKYPILGFINKGRGLRASVNHWVCDPLKRYLFRTPVYWHAQALDRPRWDRKARKIQRLFTLFGIRGVK